jgi:hypothetical protein
MNTKEVNGTGAWVFFTPDELLVVSNALNEVCNGLEVPEFATRLGVDREVALILLKSLGGVYDKVVSQQDGMPTN